ncbi:helix-turn-helix transcriptional regulator [Ornithinimicrobium panacihumi]|uniref:helix-turn-helix transcriptional regulator n=1 Tax=Ornithinimicrobium panacihumi TaxID=2008449 RepID=UPI003F8AB2D4
MLLTDDEAVAVALALRTAGSSGLAGDQEDSLRALVKLEHVLPARARARVERLGEAISAAEPFSGRSVPVDLLTTLADCVTGRVQARLGYLDRRGAATERRVEPYRLVAWGRRWYLSAFDLERDDWRTFRLDRIQDARATTFRYRPRPGEPDITTTLGSHHDPSSYRHRIELLVDAPLAELEGYAAYVTLEEVDATTTRMVSGTEDPARAAEWLLRLEHPFRIVGDKAVREALEALRGRLDVALGARD